MRVHYAVTFEFDSRPPLTYRGTVEAGQAHVCASRAIKAARKALRPINWSSLVCVFLDVDREAGKVIEGSLDGDRTGGEA